ncbi:hypothetical protein SELMODRAFT_121878 [Selaginella moellendorffii]|uniref:GOST seven transmembrane domain-containing protein n=1 Tax=Selaginella moellendorffii TaxID=88036 RepID=D8SP97_SELML|nr:hypothetical protein SELMODRAFT_121878 [Selaginella moellendorffii]
MGGILALAVVAICIWSTDASVHEYVHEHFVGQGNAYIFFGGSEGIYASTSNANRSGIGNGRSYIRFDHSVTFTRTEEAAAKHAASEHKSGLVQAVVFDVADRDLLGGSLYGGHLALCCTPDLARDVGCNQGEVILRHNPENAGSPKAINVFFRGNDLTTTMGVEEVKITKSGMYILYFVYCDPQLDGLMIDGKTVWKNPHGYLPGRMVALMTFYGFMSLAYLALGLVWFLQYSRFWKDILQLQNWITLVIGLGMTEMSFWYFDYANFNIRGGRPMGITIWAVTIGALKKTIARLLVLVVSMGYGVVRPTLGGLTSKVLLLGTTYFAALETMDVVEHVGRIDEMSNKTRLLLVLPVAILDAFFILWIFNSLSKTLEKLQARKLVVKLELYRRFTNSLTLAVIASVAWIGYEASFSLSFLYFKASDPFGENWQNAWVISAFWNVVSFLLLCVLCVLWAPSQNSMRYAYSDESTEKFDEDEAVGLTTGTLKNSFDIEKAVLKPDKEKKFGLDDTEEDKQE